MTSNPKIETIGTLRFHVDLSVNLREMKDWEPARIAAYFRGLAQVVAARQNKESA